MEKIVARDQRFNSDTESTTGWLLPGGDVASGSREVITSQSSRDGGYVTSSLPWRNDDGQLEFYVEITPSIQRQPDVLSTRYVDTSYRHGGLKASRPHTARLRIMGWEASGKGSGRRTCTMAAGP